MNIQRQHIESQILSGSYYTDRHKKAVAYIPARFKLHLNPKDIIVRDFNFNGQIFYSEIGVVVGKVNSEQGILIAWYVDGNLQPVEVVPAFQLATGLDEGPRKTVARSFYRYWKLDLDNRGRRYDPTDLNQLDKIYKFLNS